MFRLREMRFLTSNCATRTDAPFISISFAAWKCLSPLFTRAALCRTSARESLTSLRISTGNSPVLLNSTKRPICYASVSIRITHDVSDSITHTLSTTLIGADGKVVQFYPGNEWTVDQVMTDVKKTVGA